MELTIQVTIKASLENVWKSWITPSDVQNWNFASEDWACPKAVNTFKVGESFNYRMEAKDGSMGFDLIGVYTEIIDKELIEYKLEDQRKVKIQFNESNQGVTVIETFEVENQNPVEMQRQGWQNILDNFKLFVEKNM